MGRRNTRAGAVPFVIFSTLARYPGAWPVSPCLSGRCHRGDILHGYPTTSRVQGPGHPTFWDELHDADGLNLDLGALAGFPRQILLTAGDASAPFFAAVAEAIATAVPAVRYELLHGADHVPHLSAPGLYLERVTRFLASAAVSA